MLVELGLECALQNSEGLGVERVEKVSGIRGKKEKMDMQASSPLQNRPCLVCREIVENDNWIKSWMSFCEYFPELLETFEKEGSVDATAVCECPDCLV